MVAPLERVKILFQVTYSFQKAVPFACTRRFSHTLGGGIWPLFNHSVLLLQTGSMRGRGIGETLLHIVQQEGPAGLFRYVIGHVSVCVVIKREKHICGGQSFVFRIIRV